jgi:hypothetical protein
MTNTPFTQAVTKNIQAADIKALIQKQGKASIAGTEVTLKSPAATDSRLLEIIQNPAFSVKPIVGAAPSTNEAEYDVTANGKSVKIKLGFKA